MNFENGDIYHIYNQGNDRQQIFFNRNNKLFFLSKIKEFILPHADILAWCLMSNHFHLMVYVHRFEIVVSNTTTSPSTNSVKTRKLNDSIAILLRSYTRAINKQENRSGALFRESTKAECITKLNGITPSFYNSNHGTRIKTHHPEDEYLQMCFDYIHKNPARAKLVSIDSEWEFSSFRDYCGLRNGKLINRTKANELGLKIT
jgi:putative transposase